MTKTICPNCADERWVCENHPNMSWTGEPGECCGGAGMPCATCNPSSPPMMPPGFVTIHATSDDGDGTFEGQPVAGGTQ